MFIISPLSRCASLEKRDIVRTLLQYFTYTSSRKHIPLIKSQFLSHIAQIARVTENDEPSCHGYAWFKSAEDNDTVPHHWLRGFEVYDEVEASTITHRASAEYKAFRVAVGEKRLLEQPSDLRFWRPTNIGFLARKVHMNSFKNQSHGKNYIVIDELTPASGEYKHIFELLSKISLKAEKTQEVLSFWVLQREDGDKTAFLVFTSYVERDYWALFNAQTEIQDHWATLYDLSKDWSRTTWMGPGLGFLGR